VADITIPVENTPAPDPSPAPAEPAVAPAVTPEPSPASEPVAEPAAPPEVTPDWLEDFAFGRSEPAPIPGREGSFAGDPRHYDLPPAPVPAPAPAPAPRPGFNFEEFATDGHRVIDERADARFMERVAPISARLERMADGMVSRASTEARQAIERSYQQFNRDPAFRGNTVVQEKVKRGIQNILRDAELNARRAQDFSGYETITNPRFADSVLSLAKINAGVPDGTPSPIDTPGGTLEDVSSRRETTGDVVIDADTQDALRRLGKSPESYIEAMKKYGDSIEFS